MVVQVTTNESGNTASAIETSLDAIIVAIRVAQPGTPIFVIGQVPYNNAGSQYMDSNLAAINTGAQNSVAKHDDVMFVDLLPAISEWFNSANFIDSVHEYPQGYDMIAAVITNAFAAGVRQPVDDKSIVWYNGRRRLVKFAYAAPNGTDQTVIAAVTDKQIVVLGLAMSAAAATTIFFESGTATAITATFDVATRGSMVLPLTPYGLFKTTRGAALTATTGAAVQVQLQYIEV